MWSKRNSYTNCYINEHTFNVIQIHVNNTLHLSHELTYPEYPCP